MIGNYFKTGKTIVIDDERKEAQPLLNALYETGIPHHYSDGSRSSLPEQLHFRLIFLDLELKLRSTMSSDDSSDDLKNFRANHINILERLLKNENESYLLVIWSTEQDELLEAYLEIFDLSKKYHTTKKPYKVVPLVKSDFFANGEFIEGKQVELKKRIAKELEGFEAFKIFCEWESKINISTGETFDAVFQIVNGLEQGSKEESLRKLLTLLSVAYSGDEGYLNLRNNQKRTDAVMMALNQILGDDMDRQILDRREEEYKNWSVLSNYKDIEKLRGEVDQGLINTKLFTYSPNKPELTGSVYQIKKSDIIKEIFDKSLNDDIIKSPIKKAYRKENGKNSEIDEKELATQTNEEIKKIYASIIPVELNVTPLCDVSQGNDMFHRIIPGFIISAKNKSCIKTKAGFAKCTDQFKIDGLNESIKLIGNVFIYFDLRFFTSYSKESIKKRTKGSAVLPRYLFTLRANLINDFQVSLANHISRPGVLSLQDKKV